MPSDVMGTLYLLHFEPAYKHAQHYLGWTSNVEVRVEAHMNGHGSPLVKAAVLAGCQVTIVRTWPGTRSDERRAKGRSRSGRRLCPVCAFDAWAAARTPSA